MKKILLIISLLLLTYSSLSGATTTTIKDPKQAEILRTYRCMKNDSNRIKYLFSQIEMNYDKSWSLYLCKIALGDSYLQKLPKFTIASYYSQFCYYQYYSDFESMKKYLSVIKQLCFNSPYRGIYYDCVSGFLDWYSSTGNLEYSISTCKQLETEARSSKYPEDINKVYIMMATNFAYAQRDTMAICYYRRALNYPLLNIKDKMAIYYGLTTSCAHLKFYHLTLRYLNEERTLWQQYIKKNPQYKASYDNAMLYNILNRSTIYFDVNNLKEVKKLLDEARKYYSISTYVPYAKLYYQSLGRYHYLTHDYALARKEFDLSVKNTVDDNSLYVRYMYLVQAQYYHLMGFSSDAAKLYRQLVARSDSMIARNRHLQAETVIGNYMVKRELVQQERSKVIVLWLVFFFVTFMMVLCFWFAFRLFRIRKQLKIQELQTKESTELAQKANKMKDAFLHNILNEIHEPLDGVIQLSKSLSTNRAELSQEQKSDYSLRIKDSSNKLITLVNSVLDLSRLEAGMMRFHVADEDIVQVCQDVVTRASMEKSLFTHITFEKHMDSAIVNIDSGWLFKVVSSLFQLPVDSENEISAHLCLSLDNDIVCISVVGSPLAVSELSRIEQIQNNINVLFAKAFNGKYEINPDQLAVKLTLPLVKEL